MTNAIRPVCSVTDCTDVVKTLKSGLCSAHYQRWRLHGDPLAGRAKNGEVLQYFLDHLYDVGPDCQIWPYAKNGLGYGQVYVDGKKSLVHVLACAAINGPMPMPGMLACHGPCHTPSCWNGSHTSWGTYQGNSADKHRDGTVNHGQRNGAAKLTPDDVRQVRILAASGLSQSAIARQFGMTPSPINKILRGQTWSHIK